MDVLITVALVALVFWAVALSAVTFARALVTLLLQLLPTTPVGM